jgi:hypothetical protein
MSNRARLPRVGDGRSPRNPSRRHLLPRPPPRRRLSGPPGSRASARKAAAWPPSLSSGQRGRVRPSVLEAAASRHGPSLRRRVVEPPNPVAPWPDPVAAHRGAPFWWWREVELGRRRKRLRVVRQRCGRRGEVCSLWPATLPVVMVARQSVQWHPVLGLCGSRAPPRSGGDWRLSACGNLRLGYLSVWRCGCRRRSWLPTAPGCNTLKFHHLNNIATWCFSFCFLRNK